MTREGEEVSRATARVALAIIALALARYPPVTIHRSFNVLPDLPLPAPA